MGTCGIEVEDTGCGISKEDLARLGSAYVQVGDKRARNGGTGLGLAICQQLARAMGGKLEVKSEAGQGSTFSITIPGVRTAETVGTNEVNGANGKMPVPVVPLVAAVSSAPIRRILLVDDSKMNLSVLKAHLKKLGDYEIALAMDGQEALAALEASGETPFDLVFTDMWMPNLDGEGLVKAIRANPALNALRVVVVTADVELRGKAIEIGFDDILLKPITAENLIHALNEGNR
jgi:CheY-like chemotaxis protein